MSFHCLLLPFGRIFPAAALLLALWATDVCSAAEASFGANLNYSLQLPSNWTSTLNKEKANSLGANGPGGVTLNAFVFPNDRTPEGLMGMITTRVTEKKPGYKFTEKGSLKNNAGRTAHLIRYQLEAKNSTEWVEYYFQLAEKEVVALAFAFPTGAGKSFKPDIDAIFNSVKIAPASAKDDSWVDPDASPAASPRAKTAPAEKRKEDSKTTSADNAKIEGTYVQTERPTDYFVLKADGTFSIHQRAGSHTGTYTHDGATITFKFSTGETDAGKLENETLVDKFGGRWVKKSPAPAAPTTAGTQVTFATNCSVELPAGWTAKPPGKYLEGKGPGGVSVDGYSVQAAMSVDEALAQHLSVFEKMPGYELVDTDAVSTKAGAEGKLAYYRYNGKSGPVAEVGVIIKAAKNQMVTLRFLAPNAPKKLDATFQSAVEAIFSSLKISE